MVYRDEWLDIHERLKIVDKNYRLDRQWAELTKEKKFGRVHKHSAVACALRGLF